ncbi:hypothetical protein Pfo_003774 [Paulownia fortunei]|nr:hypothetical protein Pfo_003774 [Paulownia fortunei]
MEEGNNYPLMVDRNTLMAGADAGILRVLIGSKGFRHDRALGRRKERRNYMALELQITGWAGGAGAKLKGSKRFRPSLIWGLKEAKNLVEKVPVVLKQQIIKR